MNITSPCSQECNRLFTWIQIIEENTVNSPAGGGGNVESGVPWKVILALSWKKDSVTFRGNFLSAEINCILPWNLWVTSPFLINSFRSLLFPRKCQHFKIWHFKGTRATWHQIKSMLIKISRQNVTKISETRVSTCSLQLQQMV